MLAMVGPRLSSLLDFFRGYFAKPRDAMPVQPGANEIDGFAVDASVKVAAPRRTHQRAILLQNPPHKCRHQTVIFRCLRMTAGNGKPFLTLLLQNER
jgi:hypothetical protein